METVEINSDNLKKANLVIVDPYWELEDEDRLNFPEHEQECRDFVENQILPKLQYFGNVVVATWGDRQVHPALQGRPRAFNDQELQNQIEGEEIFYCGFHYGRCVLRMPAGINQMIQQGFKCYVIDNMTVLFPEDNKLRMREKTVDSGAELVTLLLPSESDTKEL